ncbi:MAG: hypothetical protein CMH57_10550 [Myxococcales bacterium]|nr:hypothetical protein [Myxococcales bacterium]
MIMASCAYDEAPEEEDGGLLGHDDANGAMDADGPADVRDEDDAAAVDVEVGVDADTAVSVDVMVDAPLDCAAWCEHALGCVEGLCQGALLQGEDFEEACLTWCGGLEPLKSAIEAFLERGCDDVGADMCVAVPEIGQRCTCGDLPWRSTTTGAPCEDDMACSANCLPEVFEGMFSGFTDGYCSAPCDSHLQCGVGNICVTFAAERACLQGCEDGELGACREGYSCWPSGLASPNGYCFPECGAALQCASGFTCVDGACRED